jgi:hypothetical protein
MSGFGKGPASAANRAATFKRLNRTRAEHRACLHVFPKTRLRFSTSVNRDLSILPSGHRTSFDPTRCCGDVSWVPDTRVGDRYLIFTGRYPGSATVTCGGIAPVTEENLAAARRGIAQDYEAVFGEPER